MHEDTGSREPVAATWPAPAEWVRRVFGNILPAGSVAALAFVSPP